MAKGKTEEKWWQKLLPLFVGLIAFTGSSLGAIYPRWAFPEEESQKRLLDSRISAYYDFFKGQAKLQEATQLREGGNLEGAKQAQDEYSRLVKDAKFRIAVYGTKAEISAVVNYFRKYLDIAPCPGASEKWKEDTRIYQEIRNGVYRNESSEKVDENSLALLLFDCQLQ